MIETVSRTGYAFLRYLATRLLRIDLMLLALVVTLTTIGFIALFSAGYSFPWRIEGQIRNIAVAGVVMLVVSCIPVKAFQKATVPIFIVGCVLLLLGENDSPLQEADQGLVKTAAGFLGKQMEN